MKSKTKLSKLREIEKFYLGFLCLALLGLILPWVNIPIIGSFNALNSNVGIIAFLLMLLIIGLFFWKKKYSLFLSLILFGISLLYFTYRIISLASIGFRLNLGILGEINLLNFIGIGVYLTLIAIIGVLIISLNQILNGSFD